MKRRMSNEKKSNERVMKRRVSGNVHVRSKEQKTIRKRKNNKQANTKARVRL